jgi:hypothetical protein
VRVIIPIWESWCNLLHPGIVYILLIIEMLDDFPCKRTMEQQENIGKSGTIEANCYDSYFLVDQAG